MYENYTRVVSRLYDPKSSRYGDDFFGMFTETAWIYNDILPQNKQQALSPDEYYDLQTSYVKQFSFQDRELALSFPQKTETGEWEIQCVFKRVVRFHTFKDCVYPKYEFSYVMTVVVDETLEHVQVKSIRVLNPLADFFIINNVKNYKIEYDGFMIDGWDDETHSHLFQSPDYDILKMECLSDNYFQPIERIQDPRDSHIYGFQRCRKNLFSVGVNYTPWGFGNNIAKDRFNGISEYSQAVSLSLFYGLQIGKAKPGGSIWFLNIGLDVNRHYYKYSGSDYTEYYDIDADGASYLRRIWIDNLSEKVEHISASLPLSVSYLLQLTKQRRNQIFLSFELGVFFEYTFLLKNKYSINADYHGRYDYYGGVEFDHYYDYGAFGQKGTQTLGTAKDLRYDYGVSGNVGCWLALDKSNMLKFSIGYKHGFNTPLKYEGDRVISENRQSYQSLLPSTKQGLRNLFLGISYVWAITLKK